MGIFDFITRKERYQYWQFQRRLNKIDKTSESKLRDIAFVRDTLLPQLGLSNDDISQYPQFLHPYCGQGIRLWQFPIQYAPYLVLLSYLSVESYLEIGVKHGGSFATINAYLNRFKKIRQSTGVDIHESVGAQRVFRHFSKSEYLITNSRSERFQEYLKKSASFDLVFIDGDHSESGARQDLKLMRSHGAIMVMHDIRSDVCPGVGRVWDELKQETEYCFFEFVEQYKETAKQGSFMGIGVAIPRARINMDTLPKELRSYQVF